MSTIKCIIVDDDFECIKHMTSVLIQFEKEFKIISVAKSYEEAVFLIDTNKPDLVFLDIDLRSEKNGFDVLYNTKFKNFDVVFTTRFDEFMIQAIRCSAFDYLLKPIEFEDIEKLLIRIKTEKKQALSFSTLFANLVFVEQGEVQIIRLPILWQEYLQSFELNSIEAFVTTENKYAKALYYVPQSPEGINFVKQHQLKKELKTSDFIYSSATISKGVKQIKREYLIASPQFMNINQKTLINTKSIIRCTRDGAYVTTKGELRFPVSPDFRAGFKF
ncbi:MAG TPA: response regulator [Chitinophagales bacterium]|nr:response regulator [Chitinophagales bacterium]HRG29537.1 response regulator [Chitinophagales bacterium]